MFTNNFSHFWLYLDHKKKSSFYYILVSSKNYLWKYSVRDTLGTVSGYILHVGDGGRMIVPS